MSGVSIVFVIFCSVSRTTSPESDEETMKTYMESLVLFYSNLFALYNGYVLVPVDTTPNNMGCIFKTGYIQYY